jgi:hypothetical protein
MSRDQGGGFFMDKMILNYKPNQYSAPDIYKYDLGKHAKNVYNYLHRHFSVEGNNAPSKNEMAYYIGFSKRTIDEGINELNKVGLIQIIPQIDRKGQHSNTYLINHPEQVEGLKLLPPYTEIKMKNTKASKKKPSADIAPHADYASRKNSGGADIAPPHANIARGTENEEKQEVSDTPVQNMHPFTSNSLVEVSNSLVEDDQITDEELIQTKFLKTVGKEISFEQAEKMVEKAAEKGLSLEEVYDEIEYTAKKARSNPAGHLFTSLSKGGYYKTKKQKEAQKKETQSKRKRLARRPIKRKPDLPESIQSEEQETGETNELPLSEEELAQKQAAIKEKLRLMNERLLVK